MAFCPNIGHGRGREGLATNTLITEAATVPHIVSVCHFQSHIEWLANFGEGEVVSSTETHKNCTDQCYFSGVSILVFASLVYVCESEVGEQVIALFFPNQNTEGKPANPWTFGECFWWAIMTVTTVGYDVNLDVS